MKKFDPLNILMNCTPWAVKKKPSKWMIYGSDAMKGMSITKIAEKHGDTRKNVMDHLNHGLKKNAPGIYAYVRKHGWR